MVPITIERSCRVPVPLGVAFDLFITLNPKDYLHHDALIAPLTDIRMIQGEAFNTPGAIQELHFKDGAVIREELLAVLPQRQFLYKGTGFSQPILSWLDHVKGSFEFEKFGDGTQITWRYNFYLPDHVSNLVRKPIFRLLMVEGIWNRMMSKTLTNLTKVLVLRAGKAAMSEE